MEPHFKLFLLHTDLPPRSHLLLAHLDDPDLIAALAEQHTLTLCHRDYSALRRVGALFGHHPSVTIRDDVFAPAGAGFDAAFVGIPKSRGLGRAAVYTALRAVKPGHRIYAVGPNNAGAKTAETDAAQLGPTETLGTKARHRLFTTLRPETPEIAAPPEWDAPWEPRQIRMTVAGHTYNVTTQPGIFSWDHPDDGTAFLIEHLPTLGAVGSPRLLDAACGYGLLGLAAADVLGARSVAYSDIDLLALACLRRTRPAAQVIAHDLTQSPLPGNPQFDLIVCNPPFHQEHVKDTSFLTAFPRHAKAMLAPGGRLAVVANSFLDYLPLMKAHFPTADKVADNRRFQILRAIA